jgi:hypothetical protein
MTQVTEKPQVTWKAVKHKVLRNLKQRNFLLTGGLTKEPV